MIANVSEAVPLLAEHAQILGPAMDPSIDARC